MGLFSAIGSIAGSIIGGPSGGSIGGALGGALDASSASKSSKSASAGAAQARADVVASSKEEIDYAKQNEARFEAIYGNLEKNLGTFYNNLTPQLLEATGLQAQQQEFQKVRRDIEKSYSQRGLLDSGLYNKDDKTLQLYNAEKRAEIRQEAPVKAAELKQSFLSLGLSQGENARQNVVNAYRGRTANLAGVASQATQAAANAATDAGNVLGDFLSSDNLKKTKEIIGDFIN